MGSARRYRDLARVDAGRDVGRARGRPRAGRQTAFRIDAIIAPRLFALGFTIGPVAALRRTWTLAPDAAGTRVTYSVEVDGPLRTPLVAGTARTLHAAAPALLEALTLAATA